MKLKFSTHPRVLSALGMDLVTDDIVAIVELVKNSYDADAEAVTITFREEPRKNEGLIEIADDGTGMDLETIKTSWLVIATPDKERRVRSPEKDRAILGEKGLGRLAAARVASRFEMLTRMTGGPTFRVEIDWDALRGVKSLDDFPVEVTELDSRKQRERVFPGDKGKGTIITLSRLRRDWDTTGGPHDDILRLREQLGRLISPFLHVKDFAIILTAHGKDSQPTEISPPEFLDHPTYSLTAKHLGDGKVTLLYRHRPSGREFRTSSPVDLWSLHGRRDGRERPSCGPFTFECRVWDRDKDTIGALSDRFGLRRSQIKDLLDLYAGIFVYRDGFLVLPRSDAQKDWLRLDLRRVQSPQHRLSNNQVVGYVLIGREENREIRDKSDREGLMETAATQDLRTLLLAIIHELERRRAQDRPKTERVPTGNLFQDLDIGPAVAEARRLAREGRPSSEIVELVEDSAGKIERARREVETRFIRYSRLATLGNLAKLIIHEIRGRLPVLGPFVRRVLEHLKRCALGDKDLDESAGRAEQAVRLLERTADRFAPFGQRIFGTRRRDSIVEELIRDALGMRAGDLGRQKIAVEIDVEPGLPKVAIDPGDLLAILANLLDNSIYWLSADGQGERKIRIVSHFDRKGKRVIVEVHDSGPGIEKEDEELIFHPGYTRKPDGTGMGLTLAVEIVEAHGGHLAVAGRGPLGGATFRFQLPPSER